MQQYLADLSIDYHGPPLIDQLANEKANVQLPNFLTVTQSGKNREIPIDAGFNEKLARFIACKARVIFKNDEQMGSRQEHCTDSFASVAPVETFMVIPEESRKLHFYQSLQLGDILICTVCDVEEHGLTVFVTGLANGKARNVSDLCIRAFCPLRELPRLYPHQDPLEGFTNRDKIKSVVIGVSLETEKILVSLLPRNLTDKNPNDKTQLGLVSDDDIPYHGEDPFSSQQSYQEQLEAILEFSNPNNVTTLCDIFALPAELSNSAFQSLGSLDCAPGEAADQLKLAQSARWAMASVEEGILYFKKGKYVEALQYFNKAMDIDPSNVEGLVARGALYANNEAYDRAVADFETALELNPKHANGRKYLCHTLIANARDVGQKGLVSDAAELYKKALDIDPDLNEALIGLQNTTQTNQSQAATITAGWNGNEPGDRQPDVGSDTSYERTSQMLKMMINEEKTCDGKMKELLEQKSSDIGSSSSAVGYEQTDGQQISPSVSNSTVSSKCRLSVPGDSGRYSVPGDSGHLLQATGKQMKDSMHYDNVHIRYSNKKSPLLDSYVNAPCFQYDNKNNFSPSISKMDKGAPKQDNELFVKIRKCVKDETESAWDGHRVAARDVVPQNKRTPTHVVTGARHAVKLYEEKNKTGIIEYKEELAAEKPPFKRFKAEAHSPPKDFERSKQFHPLDSCQSTAVDTSNKLGSYVTNKDNVLIKTESNKWTNPGNCELSRQSFGQDFTKRNEKKPRALGLKSTKQHLTSSRWDYDRSMGVPVNESGNTFGYMSKEGLSTKVLVSSDSPSGVKRHSPAMNYNEPSKSQPIRSDLLGHDKGDISSKSHVFLENRGSHYEKNGSQGNSSSYGQQTNKIKRASQDKRQSVPDDHTSVKVIQGAKDILKSSSCRKDKRKSITTDVSQWVEKGQEPHPLQQNILQSLRKNDKTSMPIQVRSQSPGRATVSSHKAKSAGMPSELQEGQSGHDNPWESKWDSPPAPTSKVEGTPTKQTPKESLEDLENFLLLLKQKKKK